MHSPMDRIIPYREGEALYRSISSKDKAFWEAKNAKGRSFYHIAGFSESLELRNKLLHFIERTGKERCPAR